MKRYNSDKYISLYSAMNQIISLGSFCDQIFELPFGFKYKARIQQETTASKGNREKAHANHLSELK
jgi:hypothetical protein